MKIFNYIIAAIMVVCMASCGTSRQAKGIKPYESARYSQMNDLVCVGECEVSVEYSTYLGGLLTNIHKVNGAEYDALQKTRLNNVRNSAGRCMSRAYYQAYEKFPNAVYFEVASKKKESTRLFLGNNIKRTAVVRAYEFKK